MAEATLLRTQGQYDRIIRDIALEHSSVSATVLDNLIILLKEAVQEQYVEAQMIYDDKYGWSMDPEKTFEEWLDYEYPELADLPEWLFYRKVEDGS